MYSVYTGTDDGGDGRASAIGDFNNDGFMDMILLNVARGTSILYSNNTSGNNWITIRLNGTFSNRNGIGAKIKVQAGSLVQIKEVTAGASFASMNTLDIGFGLKKEPNVDNITVYWPSGNVQELTNIKVNQIKTITEPDELTVVGVEEEQLLSSFNLHQNYPNPFNPITTIRYSLEMNSEVIISIYDVTGREVAKLVDDNISAGEHEVQWDASEMASGLYIYQLKTDSFTHTKKMILLK